MGEKPAPWVAGHAEDPGAPTFAVALRFSPAKGGVSVVRDLSLSRSSVARLEPESLTSVRRRSKAGGGVVVLGSSLEKRETVAGEATEVDGNGYASLVSRRRLLGRVLVGEDSP
jgi:hypothetical protein